MFRLSSLLNHGCNRAVASSRVLFAAKNGENWKVKDPLDGMIIQYVYVPASAFAMLMSRYERIAVQNVSLLVCADEKLKREAVTGISGCALTVTEVATPKVLPPPPRSAQKRSVCEVELATTNSPSAVTTSKASTLSAPVP